MKAFDPHLILMQCCPKPLGEDYKVKSGYSMIVPFAYCSWDRGFYIQPVIREFSFQHYSSAHSSKKTFLFTRWTPKTDPPKKITGLDGKTTTLFPVLGCYICVNRDLFPPLEAKHNQVEWLKNITQRTKGIAHELLYIDHYAKHFDIGTGKNTVAIQIPSVDQEDELLCPYSQIEMVLHAVETEFGIKFADENDFLGQQGTSIVQKYYSHWLKEFGVERDVCHRRTIIYLHSGLRAYNTIIETAIVDCAKRHGIPKIDAQRFKTQMNESPVFATDFLNSLRTNGCVGFSDSELSKHASVLLARKNGS